MPACIVYNHLPQTRAEESRPGRQVFQENICTDGSGGGESWFVWRTRISRGFEVVDRWTNFWCCRHQHRCPPTPSSRCHRSLCGEQPYLGTCRVVARRTPRIATHSTHALRARRPRTRTRSDTACGCAVASASCDSARRMCASVRLTCRGS